MVSMATSLITTNMFTCEQCHKKLKDNPDIIENNYSALSLYETNPAIGIMTTASGTASMHVENINPYIGRLKIKINNN